MNSFMNELRELINKYSKENGSNTPDYILAAYLERCLDNFDITVQERDKSKRANDKNYDVLKIKTKK